MKRYQRYASLLILMLAITAILSCKKEDQHQYMNNAQIIGYDLRLCVCCGGYQVTIDSVANPNGGSFFLVGQFPSSFHLGENPRYPIPVKIDWEADTARCFGNYIKISRITTR
jgi:hypothetical protein